jgi:hypothetical protein
MKADSPTIMPPKEPVYLFMLLGGRVLRGKMTAIE